MATAPHILKNELATDLAANLADTLVVRHDIQSKAVESAFRTIPRHLFVERYYRKDRLIHVPLENLTRKQLHDIYRDDPILTHRRRVVPTSSTTQPTLVAWMLEDLNLEPGMNVLEIGAGTGWNAALMAHIVGPTGRVSSVEMQSDVAEAARRHIHRSGIKNVKVITGDGGCGYLDAAPYDRIITTANYPNISPQWVDQLTGDGMLLISLQDVKGSNTCLLSCLWKRQNHLEGMVVRQAGFMMLRGTYGTTAGLPNTEKYIRDIKIGRRAHREIATWTQWHIREDVYWKCLAPFVFFLSLNGFSVEAIGEMTFAVRLPGAADVCVISDKQAMTYGEGTTYQILMEALKKWLAIGAPGFTEYLLEVRTSSVRLKRPSNGWLLKRDHYQYIFRLKEKKC